MGGCLAMQVAPAQVPRTPTSPQYMEKLSQLAYHPLKMQSCYEKMEPLRLDGLQQRFDVSSTSVFKQRAQIHMREVGPRLLPQHIPYPCSPHTRLPQSPSPGRAARPYSLAAPSCANYSHTAPACSLLLWSPICLGHLFLPSPA